LVLPKFYLSRANKIKPLLWTHKKAANGEHEIRLRLTLHKDVSYLNTGFTSSLKNWDNGNECPKYSHPKFKVIIKKIQELTDEINFEVKLNLKNGIDVFSLSDLKNKIKTPIKKSNKIKILEFYKY
jgi:integrase/recombinase XerD